MGECQRPAWVHAWPLVSALVLSAILAPHASAQLSADFSGAPLSGPAPLTVFFTDLSTGETPQFWYWTFGDADTSQEQNPLHTYTQPGTYSVVLTVQTLPFSIDTEFKAGYIVVTAPHFSPSFRADPSSGQVPLTVQFNNSTALSGVGFKWAWTFGDGTSSSAQHPTHTFSSVGSFDITLKANYFGQSDTDLKPALVVVDPAPLVVQFSASPSSGLAPLSVAFTDLSTGAIPTAWFWDFGDGATSSAQHPTHEYSLPGSYTVLLQALVGSQSQVSVALNLVQVGPFGGVFLPGTSLVMDSFSVESSVTGQGSRILLGCPTCPPGGSALMHAMEPSGAWTFEGLLLPDEVAPGDAFGRSVSLHGERALVGGLQHDAAGKHAGAAWVFDKPVGGPWQQLARLLAGGAVQRNQYFGSAAAHQDGRLVVGAPGADAGAPAAGRVSVFGQRPSGAFERVAELSAASPKPYGHLGARLALEGDRILASAPGLQGGRGEVLVFERQLDGHWQETAVLPGAQVEPGDGFGSALALRGELAFVGRPDSDVGAVNAGAVSIFQRRPSGAWVLLSVLQNPAPELSLNLGRSLAVLGNRLVVGAPGPSVPPYASGRAHVFVQGPGPGWNLLANVNSHPFATHFGGGVAWTTEQLAVTAREFGSKHTAQLYLDVSADAATDGPRLQFESPGVVRLSGAEPGQQLTVLLRGGAPRFELLGSLAGLADGAGGLLIQLDTIQVAASIQVLLGSPGDHQLTPLLPLR